MNDTILFLCGLCLTLSIAIAALIGLPAARVILGFTIGSFIPFAVARSGGGRAT